jgi:predicted hotdog family 3-hydroxylacyl-ACP dehydratase
MISGPTTNGAPERAGGARTTGAAYPPVADVLPQTDAMVLLADVLEHSAEATRCTVHVRETGAFTAAEGLMPPWVGMEYMAQCIAAHRGLRARSQGAPIKVGFLIGARRVDFHVAGFRLGQRLEVSARHLWGDRGLGAFACILSDLESGTVLGDGQLNVFLPDDLAAFTQKGTLMKGQS